MPKFKEDWTKAKATFEAATKKKKPSASFLVVFSKGTGIGGALESADKAKNAGELTKAMGDFQKAAGEYFKLLEKAIADPKTTPTADKAAYAEAVKKLKTDLLAIQKTAEATLQTLTDSGAGKKDKISPADLKKQVEAEKEVTDHTNRRKALAVLLGKTLVGYKAKNVEGILSNVMKQVQTAKSAKSQGNTMGADIGSQAAARFSQDANQTLDGLDDHWERLSTKGEMVDLRSDASYTDLPPDKAEDYKRNAGAAFRETEKVQREINAYLGKLRSDLLIATSAAESVESLSIGRLTPDAYIKRIATIQKQIESKDSLLGKYAGKIPNLRAMQKKRAEELPKTPQYKPMTVKMWTDLKAEHEYYLPQAAQIKKDFAQMEGRLNAIPQDDKGVKEATASAKVVLAKVRKLADDYIPQGQEFVKELTSYLSNAS